MKLDNRGANAGLLSTACQIAVSPWQFFESIGGKEGMMRPLSFALVMIALGIVIGGIEMLALDGDASFAVVVGGAFIMIPVVWTMSAFIGGGVVWAITTLADGRGTYASSVCVACYSTVVMPLCGLLEFAGPVSFLPWLYGVGIAAMGIIVVHEASAPRTCILTGLLFAGVLLFGLGVKTFVGAIRNPSGGSVSQHAPIIQDTYLVEQGTVESDADDGESAGDGEPRGEAE